MGIMQVRAGSRSAIPHFKEQDNSSSSSHSPIHELTPRKARFFFFNEAEALCPQRGLPGGDKLCLNALGLPGTFACSQHAAVHVL